MKKPLPIAIAEAFEQLSIDHLPDGYPAIQQKKLNAAAAVLRAQHTHINELLAALNMLKAWDFGAAVKTHEDEKQMDKLASFARSAISKAEGGAA